jgi:ribulose-phosphate 3-epimerase
MQAGVSLNPHTPVSVLEDIIADLDLVLIMSVNPGFGGQRFIENTYAKVSSLKALIERKNSNALIEVDGGVTDQNIEKLSEMGVDAFVAGSFVFRSEDPLKTIQNLKRLASK